MIANAPRPLLRLWRDRARSALLAFVFVVRGASADTITGARYVEPTTRYTHGILGDAVEWGALVIDRANAPSVRVVLPQTRVFEDIAPRVVDVTGDGRSEVMVVESDLQRGARLALYDADGLLAATPFIGQANRWLAPVGAADLDGDGAIEIAYVDRPHLAKTLRIWRYVDGQLREVASLPDVTNHRIGWDYVVGGLRACADGPEMVLASGDWNDVVVVRFDGDLMRTAVGTYSDRRISDALTCR